MTAVSVTAEHIAAGDRDACESCPVALAIAQTFPDLTYVSVGQDDIAVKAAGGDKISLRTPSSVREFIWDFDDLADVEPFTFELDYPAVTR